MWFLAAFVFPWVAQAEAFTYHGCCDASAAAPVNASLFAAASDEDNVLRLFRRDQGGAAVAVLNVSTFLALRRSEEADLEDAARVGGNVFWIGSHSRNSDGQLRTGRHVFFATAIRGNDLLARLQPIGRPFTSLVASIGADPSLTSLNLASAAEKAGEARGGLNIEGLGAGPDNSLLIGFRNPVPDGLALMIPLLNPEAVIEGAPPRFGPAARLALGGLGIRGLARTGDGTLILGGPAEGGGRHRLFYLRDKGSAPVEVARAVPKEFQAESLLVDDAPGTRLVDLLSDDGGEKHGGQRCEELKDATRRSFRALRVSY